MLFRSHYAEWVKLYKELLTVLTAINWYLRQSKADKKYLDEMATTVKQAEEDNEAIMGVYSESLAMVDVPAANLTPEQFSQLLNPTPATAQIPQPQVVAGAAGPAQPQQMILLDRNMAQIIKTKPLTDSARPAEIQSWSEALISVYQLQQLDRMNTQLALVYMKSHLDTALSAILSCFMENKPLYLDRKSTRLNSSHSSVSRMPSSA